MVDFNPRAVRFSRWNALLNGVQNKVEVYYGDLYHAIDDSLSKAQKRKGRGLFDVILANPPYLPTPPEAATDGSSRPVENAYGDGGVDGERLLAAVMVGARRYVNRLFGGVNRLFRCQGPWSERAGERKEEGGINLYK